MQSLKRQVHELHTNCYSQARILALSKIPTQQLILSNNDISNQLILMFASVESSNFW